MHSRRKEAAKYYRTHCARPFLSLNRDHGTPPDVSKMRAIEDYVAFGSFLEGAGLALKLPSDDPEWRFYQIATKELIELYHKLFLVTGTAHAEEEVAKLKQANAQTGRQWSEQFQVSEGRRDSAATRRRNDTRQR